jgi:hypothetical protein
LVVAKPNRLPDRGHTVLLIESIFIFCDFINLPSSS